jgi:hypothetical protein
MIRAILIINFLFQFVASVVYSQPGISSDGREYYLAAIQPSFMTSTSSEASKYVSSQRITLMVTSLAQTDVSISYFESNGKENIPTIYHVSPTSPKQIPLDVAKINSIRPGDAATYNACHIVSQAPISVQLTSIGAFSGGAYQPLPLQCLGKKYVVMSYHDNPLGYGGVLDLVSNPKSAGFFIIVAPYNNTTVQITPTSTTLGGNPGVRCGAGATQVPKPYSVSLYKGQTYMVESAAGEAACDISGTTIESTLPIIVLAGHENANTEGSQIIGLADETDWRDFMIEQLLPVECFDTAGYYTIPFQGPTDPTASGGEGDEVRAFCNGTTTSAVQFTTGTNNTIDFSCSPFQIAGPNKVGLTVPSALYSLNGQPFSVMMYDQRSQGKSGSGPAPSMTSIIPKSLWKSEYFWSVVYQPSNKQNTYFRQDSYLNIICRKDDYYEGNLKIAYANNPITPLLHSGLIVKRTWNSIPTSADLIGLTIATDNGNFHLVNTAVNQNGNGIIPFAAYISGSGLYDPYNRPSDPPRSSSVGYGFSQPLGIAYKAFGVKPPKFSAITTEYCDHWNICLTDSGGQENGIRYIELLNYENSTIIPKPAIAKNVAFDNTSDPLGKGEIVLEDMPKNYCFSVFRKAIPDSCRAVISVYDNSGDRFMIDLSGKIRPVASSDGELKKIKDNIYEFTPPHIDSQVCGRLILKNSDPIAPVDLVISDIIIPKNALFTVTSGLPTFPVTLHKSDSLVLNVCFVPKDTSLAKSTIQFVTNCPEYYAYTLQGRGTEGLINATDVAFSDIQPGTNECKKVTVTNAGTYPFTITSYSLDNRTSFTLDVNFVASLPITLQPGASVSPDICFHPQDYGNFDGRIDWNTNLIDQTRIKSYSLLNGKSSKPTTSGEESSLTRSTFSARYTQGLLIIDMPSIDRRGTFELFDVLGRRVTEWQAEPTTEQSMTHSLPILPSGAYILRMQSGTMVKSCVVILR